MISPNDAFLSTNLTSANTNNTINNNSSLSNNNNNTINPNLLDTFTIGNHHHNNALSSSNHHQNKKLNLISDHHLSSPNTPTTPSSSSSSLNNTPTTLLNNNNNNNNTSNDYLYNSLKQRQKYLNEYQVSNHLPNIEITNIHHLNILLIGEKGAGKSSLLSTFHRALFENYIQEPIAKIGENKTSSFTKKKKGYALNLNDTIYGHDTRGLETFLKAELEQMRAIRDGKVGDDVEIKQKEFNWSFWDYLFSFLSKNPASILDPECLIENTTIQDIPHAIIFVIPANQRHVPNELEDFVNLFLEYGYKPLFAITKIDCFGDGDVYAATHVYDTKKSELMGLYDLDFNDICAIQNYTNWNVKNVSIESMALDLLQKAVHRAENFIIKHVENERELQRKSIYGIGNVFNKCNIQ
ncbi:hypothetical protein ABK040_005404 [Willaertia magna]